jgi:hypothetical protein
VTGELIRNAMLYAVSGVAPAHCSGVVNTLMPSRCSDSASAPGDGQKIGASHHPSVIVSACAFHDRIAAFSEGSMLSCGHADDRWVTTGHRNRMVGAA